MPVLIALRVPADSERGPLYMDQALAAIHQANSTRLPLTLEFGVHQGSATLLCHCPEELHATVATQLYAHYPDVRIDAIPEASAAISNCQSSWSAALQLASEIFPIKRYPQFEDALNRLTADPLTALLSVVAADANSPLRARIALTIQPASRRRRLRAQRCLLRLATPFFRTHHRIAHLYRHLALSPHAMHRFLGWLLGRCGRPAHTIAPSDALHTSSSRLHEREEDVQAAGDKLGRMLFEAQIHITVTGPEAAAADAQRKLRHIAGAFGIFHAPGLATFHVAHARRSSSRPSFLLSTEEVATLWHPPTVTVRAPTLTTVDSREFEPPVALPISARHPDLTLLGNTIFRGKMQPFGILPEDRFRHLAIVGKTGMGKTTLLQRLISTDITGGRGVAVLDPHGDLIESVLAAIPRRRTNDVILLDAGDASHPLSFNVLACPRPELRPLTASGLVSSFKKVYGDSWGPRLEHILRNALLALLEVPGTTLVSLLRLLSDAGYRRDIVGRLSDPVVRAFWEHEFAAMHAKLQIEAIAPIQNKVGAFVSSPLLRNIVGQARSSLDFRALMDDGKILLLNLSKGRVGDDASALLGSFLVTALQLAALSRADIPEAKRRDFFLYVDEFQNYATEAFATILSEARKYRLSLTIANQYLAQLDEATAAAVFGNVGTLVTFQVGAQDAELLAQQLGGDVQPPDVLALPRYQALVRLLIDGMPSRPFSMRTLPTAAEPIDPERAAIIRRTSRQRYARPLPSVEADLRRTLAHF